MSAKPKICVVAVLLPSGEVDYRMREHDMAEALAHPDARLGVMLFYGDHGIGRTTSCPHCGQETGTARWGWEEQRPPVFVCDGEAFRLRKVVAHADHYPYNPYTRWKITGRRETSALIDNRRVQWVLNDWLERNT